PLLTPPQDRRLLANVGQIDPVSVEAYRSRGGYAALERALTGMTPAQVIEAVTESGLQGRGGAGFPAGRKWAFTAAAPGKPKYILCNADESEPGTFKDRVLLEHDPHRVLEGILLAGYAVGAEHGIIYLRGEYLSAFHRLEQAIEQARAAGLLGDRILGTDFHFHLDLHRGSGAYICGEETALIESLEGKRGEPRMRPPYPPTYGLWGKPTVVNNVETLANVPDIVRDGAEAFKQHETKLYCLSGHVTRQGLIEAPLGLTLRQAIETYGGGMAGGASFGFAQTGGAAGTLVGPAALDVPLTFTSARTDGVALGSGALLIAADTVGVADLLLAVMEFFARESCGKCYPCRYGTVRAVEILRRQVAGEPPDDALPTLAAIARELAAASFCGLGQAAAIPLQSGLKLLEGVEA
ncbi:MAG: NADP oxidoreductase, partial [Caldilineae bacterium]